MSVTPGSSAAGAGEAWPGHEVIRPPAVDARHESGVGRFAQWVERRRDLRFETYGELWQWSVGALDDYWADMWDYFEVKAHTPYEQVLRSPLMPNAEWFPGATLNYAEHLVGADESLDDEALMGHSQTRETNTLTFGNLRDQIARAAAGLRRLGVTKGDRVVAYMPNITETVVAYAATASIGAVWSSCAPEFGARSVIDRFGQIEPTVLLAVAGYRYGDKHIDRSEEMRLISAGLPTLRHVVNVPYGTFTSDDTATNWQDLLSEPADLTFEPVDFAHPLVIMFSSGTTGLPKAIVHGHGGILLEHLKTHGLAWDTRPADRVLWFSTTAWTMWNALVSTLLLRGTAVLFDGNPLFPTIDAQWALAAESRASLLGTSPAFLMACRKAGIEPARAHDLDTLRMVGVTGAPLPAEGFDWIYDQLGRDVILNALSGGTDVAGSFVTGGPWQPVMRGEIAGPALGVDAASFDEAGTAVVDKLGELVIRQPMPSMPIGFWNDPDDERYTAAYFDTYPGIWRHGDWVRFGPDGSCVMAGRSDSTLNRGGVRLGSAEFYRVVEEMEEVDDSLVVHLEDPAGGPGQLTLFVVPAQGRALDDGLELAIRRRLGSELSPRHVPDSIVAVPAVPRTLTGKKLETPVKKILQGALAVEVASPDALDNPESLLFFESLARGTIEDP